MKLQLDVNLKGARKEILCPLKQFEFSRDGDETRCEDLLVLKHNDSDFPAKKWEDKLIAHDLFLMVDCAVFSILL